MQIKRTALIKATDQGILTKDQAEQLWLFLKQQNKDVPSLQITHVLYYIGGLIAIGAMALLMLLNWKSLNGLGLFFICIIYGVIGIFLVEKLLKKYKLNIPAAILATFVLTLVPIAIYALLIYFGYWIVDKHYPTYRTYIDWNYLLMELATLGIGSYMLSRYKLPLLLMPMSVTLWFMTMNVVVSILSGLFTVYYFELKEYVSMGFGLAMILVAFIIDIKIRNYKDYSFWLYLVGSIIFWAALSYSVIDDELNKFLYMCINLVMIVIGTILVRYVFVILGTLGLSGYLIYLANNVFKGHPFFLFILTCIGLSIIVVGIYWQRHEKQIRQFLQQFLPKGLRELIEYRNN